MHGVGAAEMTAVTSYSCQQSPFMDPRARREEERGGGGEAKKMVRVTGRSISSLNNGLVSDRVQVTNRPSPPPLPC